ncbi:hypothetical protein NDU88_000426 [Pleurodeles waltl]|uniref:Uncharacterized protein n=1 Tax=Pleurodeles waltl TaxID=8319 RepID=A0AAV7P892_PLEWA|nr:hypothetical protein NDU88_000426 [Pleurodeles waltl]
MRVFQCGQYKGYESESAFSLLLGGGSDFISRKRQRIRERSSDILRKTGQRTVYAQEPPVRSGAAGSPLFLSRGRGFGGRRYSAGDERRGTEGR